MGLCIRPGWFFWSKSGKNRTKSCGQCSTWAGPEKKCFDRSVFISPNSVLVRTIALTAYHDLGFWQTTRLVSWQLSKIVCAWESIREWLFGGAASVINFLDLRFFSPRLWISCETGAEFDLVPLYIDRKSFRRQEPLSQNFDLSKA